MAKTALKYYKRGAYWKEGTKSNQYDIDHDRSINKVKKGWPRISDLRWEAEVRLPTLTVTPCRH